MAENTNAQKEYDIGDREWVITRERNVREMKRVSRQDNVERESGRVPKHCPYKWHGSSLKTPMAWLASDEALEDFPVAIEVKVILIP